ncbi:MAG: hypothetical protein DCC65_09810 [Planctomycetota bacterium]|nr:MAG: hypothetical protein DCC65_09810 [Planctomycetota bacterium]
MARVHRRRRMMWVLMAGFAALSILDHAGVFGYRPGDRRRYDGARATVRSVIDGRTIEVDLPDGRSPITRLRLRGLAAPDAEHDAAAEYLRIHLADRNVRILLDPNRGPRAPSGELLAYIVADEGDDTVNARLIALGLARAETGEEHVFALAFAQREQTARRQKRGLWAVDMVRGMP